MRIDYDSARRNAKKLGALAENCETAAKRCRSCQAELSQYWKGGAADSYAAGLARLSQKNTALSQQIEQMARTIAWAADEMEEEDRALAAKIAARAAASKSQVKQSTPSAASSAKKTAAAAKPAASAVKDNVSTLASAAMDLVSRLFGKG